MHNVNRSNSYDDIDLDFFLEMYPEQDVKMTVSRETLPHLAEGVIELHQKDLQCLVIWRMRLTGRILKT